MLPNYLVDVFFIYVRVPNAFRIHSNDRALFAAVHAAGGVDPHVSGTREAKRLDARFRVVAKRLRVVVGAARRAVVAFVGAKEYVVSVVRLVLVHKKLYRVAGADGERYLRPMTRNLTPSDRAIGFLDQAVRLLFGPPPTPDRPNPANRSAEVTLDTASREASGRLMRVNHSGEVCAQALYQGQAFTARNTEVRAKLERAAREENDHLAWTTERITELGGRPSYLNPLWYSGSLAIGAVAGVIGDRWSLGFLVETERQVVEHLEGHLERLPTDDARSRAIVEQMREDEGRHATTAVEAGASELPPPAKRLMRLVAKVMTTTSYWV